MSSECSEDDLPLVTIITPTYNSNPQYLKEAIESVLVQTYPKIEYIITDDGSSIFHEELIHELLEVGNRGNITWKVIRFDVNSGIVKNMNGAIRESHGEYIFPLAHDDVYYDERVIEEWVGEFQRTGASIITACMNIPEMHETVPVERDRMILQNQEKYNLRRVLRLRNIICAPATAQSRESFLKYGLYDETYTLLEDHPRWIKLAEKGVTIVFWNRSVIKYRNGGVSSTPNIILQKDRVMFHKYIVSLEHGVWKIPLNILAILQKIRYLLYQSESSQKIKKLLEIIIDKFSIYISGVIIRSKYVMIKKGEKIS